MTDVIFGTDVFLFVDDVMVGCGKSISVKASRKEIATTCTDSGGVETAKTGKAKYSYTLDLAWRKSTGAEVATNVTAFEFFEKFLANNEVEIQFKENAVNATGDIVYFGTGYIKDLDLNGVDDEQGTINVQGFFNEFDVFKALGV